MVRLANGARMSVAHGAGAALGQKVEAVVRAHRVIVGPPGAGGANRFAGKVQALSYLGGTCAYFIDSDGIRFQAINTIDQTMFREGDAVSLTVSPEDCVLLDSAGRRIGA